jgi:N-acetylneuraminic acid mutarotase
MCPRASRALITLAAAMQTMGLVAVALTLAGCGHDDNTSTATTTNYTVGGTITGLTVSSVVLANGTATVAIAAGTTSWVFPNSFAAGTSYSVTVQTQPVGELCEVTSGATGVNTGSVGNVTVVCGYGQWTWEGGLSTVNASGVYGTQLSASTSNAPGARYSASSWTGSSGIFWLFGGVGYDSSGAVGNLNDLWRYSPSTKDWTWVSGGSLVNTGAVYGTQGTASASNVPGARYSASSWIDSHGNLWLFGGVGYDSTGAVGNLNDLWRYSPSTNEWTWVSGGSGDNASPVYGTRGTAAAANVPGARYSASSWIDSTGNLWLFGGVGDDSTGAVGNLNDLWRYSPSTNEWTWINGGSGDNAAGVYGTEGTASASIVPGGRYSASSWVDSSNDLWLYGGYGCDSTGTAGKLNDLWKYTPSSGQWTWISGSDVANVIGAYGTLGTVATTSVPGSRQGASSWIDSSGNLWLFGGVGYDSTGAVGNLGDLWKYSPSANEWTWMSGADLAIPTGVYGTRGTASVGDVVGGRNSMSSWIDVSGNLWLFGGNGYDSAGNLGYLNDLWQYNPS